MGEELIIINSKDRYSGTSTSFKIRSDRLIRDIEWIKLCYAYIPNMFYNINSNNNVLTVEEGGGGDVSVTLTNGNYNISELISHIQTKLNAAGGLSGTFTVTYNDITMKITIASTVDFSLNFSNSTSTIYKILGFDNEDKTPDASNWTGDNPVDLQYIENYNIVMNNIGEYVHNITDNSYFFSFVIPNNKNKTEIVEYYENKNFEQKIDTGKTLDISYLDIELRDQSNKIVDLNSIDWHFIIKIKKM